MRNSTKHLLIWPIIALIIHQPCLEAASSKNLPTGGKFVAGKGNISTTGNILIINQNSLKGIIDWSTFSIGAGATVKFLNGTGATLNKVTGTTPTTIFGQLLATGNVYLLNPEGVLVGKGATIHTGGDFVATTLNIPNSSFLSDGPLTFASNSQNTVVNLGTITSDGGNIYLIGHSVSNNGNIASPNGTTGLAAGSQVTLTDTSTNQKVTVQAPGGDVTNSGFLSAAQIELKSNGGNIYALAGNNGGQIQATGTATQDGHVWLIATNGTTSLSGSISATNSDGTGGLIETSGAHVNAGAATIRTGKNGNWLLDPDDLTIDSSLASTIEASLNSNTNVTESTSAPVSGGLGNITVSSNIAWTTASTLTLSAYNDFTLNNGVTISNTGAGNLVIAADNTGRNQGGLVTFNGTGKVDFSGSTGNVSIFYNPSSYASPVNYSSSVLTNGSWTAPADGSLNNQLTAYMLVNNASQLQSITMGDNYALGTNISLSTQSPWTPLGNFTGVFNGLNHTLTGLNVTASSGDVGLFSDIGSGGIVKNLQITNAAMPQTGSGAANTGILAGQNSGTITNVTVSGSITDGSSNNTVGGLVGTNYGSVDKSSSNVLINATSPASVGGLAGVNSGWIGNSYSAGFVTDTNSTGAYVGGLVGYNQSIISTSYSFSPVSGGDNALVGGLVGYANPGSSITDTYARGAVTGGANSVVGGLVGYLDSFPSATVDSSYATGAVTGGAGATKGGLIGNNGATGNITNSYFDSVYSVASNGVGSGDSSGVTSTATSSLQNGNLPSGFSGSNWSVASGAYPFFPWQGSAVAISGSAQSLPNVGVGLLSGGVLLGLTKTDSSSNGYYYFKEPANMISSTGILNYLTNTGDGVANVFRDIPSFYAVNLAGLAPSLLWNITGSNTSVSNLAASLKATVGNYAVTIPSNFLFSIAGANTISLVNGTELSIFNPSTTFNIDQSFPHLGTTLINILADLSIASGVSLTANSGKTITLGTTGNFINHSGASALNVSGGGIWDVYSTNPTLDQPNGLTPNYYQYNTAIQGSTLGTGNGFLYSLAPNISFTFTGVSKNYDGNTSIALTNSNFVEQGLVSGDTVNVTSLPSTGTFSSPNASNTATVSATGVSVNTATATRGGLPVYNYTSSGTATGTGVINPLTLTYTATPAAQTYGNSNNVFSGTVTGFLSGENLGNATTGTLAFTSATSGTSDVGSFAINGSGLSATNYTFQQAPANSTALTINPALLTYVASAANQSYGSANTAFGGTVTGFLNGQNLASATTGTLAFTSSTSGASNVGTYSITGSGLSATNYTFQQAAGNSTALTINPALLTYAATPTSQTYGTANNIFSGTVTGFVNGQNLASATTGTLAFASSTDATTSAGSYAITGSGLTANANYTLQQAASNSTALTINPAVLTYTANPASQIYGNPNNVFTGTVSGFVNGQNLATATTGTLAFTSPTTATSNVGTYAINGSGLSATNYTFQQSAGSATALTINPAVLTYAANPASQIYGNSNNVFTGTVSGFVNGQNLATATTGTLTFTSPTTATSNVGTYAINGSGLSATNYTFQQSAGSATALTINPAVLTYAANPASQIYGSSNSVFTGTVTGFVNGQNIATATTGTLAFTSPATATSNVGTYAINGSGLSATNYTFQQSAGSATALTINPAVLTYAANPASQIYGNPNNVFTGTVSGFVNGQNLATATTGTLTFTSPTSATSNVGTYAINGSGLSATNYIFGQSVASASALTINPALLTYVANPVTQPYGSNLLFTGTVTGFVNGQNINTATTGTLTFSVSNLSNMPGTYSITGSGLLANHGNYTFTQAAGNSSALTLTNPTTPIALPVSINNAVILSGQNPAFTSTYTGPAINGLNISSLLSGLSYQVSPLNGAGTYQINATGTAPAGFTFSFTPATLTVVDSGPVTLTSQITQFGPDLPSLLSVTANPLFDNAFRPASSIGQYQVSVDYSFGNLNLVQNAWSQSWFYPNAKKLEGLYTVGAKQ